MKRSIITTIEIWPLGMDFRTIHVGHDACVQRATQLFNRFGVKASETEHLLKSTFVLEPTACLLAEAEDDKLLIHNMHSGGIVYEGPIEKAIHDTYFVLGQSGLGEAYLFIGRPLNMLEHAGYQALCNRPRNIVPAGG